MKLTPSLQKFINSEIEKWSKNMSVLLSVNVLTKTKQVLDLPRSFTEGRRTSAYKYLGVAFLEPLDSKHVVFLNVLKHKSRTELRHTIVHELVHFRFPYLSHGYGFDFIINSVLKGKQLDSCLMTPDDVKMEMMAIEFTTMKTEMITEIRALNHRDLEILSIAELSAFIELVNPKGVKDES